MTFSTSLYSGWITRTPKIFTDINAESTLVRIKVNVVKPSDVDSLYPVQIEPWNLCFYPSDGETIENIEFEITNVSDEPLGLKRASWPDSLVKYTIPWTIPSGDSAFATVHVDVAAYESGFYKSLTFELSDHARTRFTIPVTGEAPSFPDLIPCEYTALRD